MAFLTSPAARQVVRKRAVHTVPYAGLSRFTNDCFSNPERSEESPYARQLEWLRIALALPDHRSTR